MELLKESNLLFPSCDTRTRDKVDVTAILINQISESLRIVCARLLNLNEFVVEQQLRKRDYILH